MIRFFESPDQAGTDVISMNINRGRDHGIAGYMEWRKMCKLSTADQFSSLTDHTPEMVKLLQSQYRFVMKSLFLFKTCSLFVVQNLRQYKLLIFFNKFSKCLTKLKVWYIWRALQINVNIKTIIITSKAIKRYYNLKYKKKIL